VLVSQPATEVDPQYPNAAAWVQQWLAAVVERRVDRDQTGQGALWCPRWWGHPEARIRLYALWREWEVAWAVDALADWWTAFDQHWTALTSETGPFTHCKSGHHQPLPALEVETMPEDMLEHFPDFDPDQVLGHDGFGCRGGGSGCGGLGRLARRGRERRESNRKSAIRR
jgi:hypothetical protein